VDKTVDLISIFTWPGNILYYKGSRLPAILAVGILIVMARVAERRFVRGKMHVAQPVSVFRILAILGIRKG
jgi:hypothetical protein